MVIGNLKKGSKSSLFVCFFFNVNTAGFKSCRDLFPTTKALERTPTPSLVTVWLTQLACYTVN